MIKAFIVFFFIIQQTQNYSQPNIAQISYLLGKKQNDRIGKLKQYTFYQVRKKLFDKYPQMFKRKIDSIYFIEKYDVEQASYYGMIWTNYDTVQYSFSANKISLVNEKIFITKLIRWATSWDIASIRKEEEKYPNINQTVYISKCVVIGNRCQFKIAKTKDLLFDREDK
jgi:hypothetical protein